MRLERERVNEAAWLVLVAGLWAWTFQQLAFAWRTYPTYQFGYAVPWAALFLAWRSPRPAARAGPRPRWPLALAGAMAWGCFLLGELVRRLQPQSRGVGWLLLLAATLLSAAWLWQRGGRPLLRALAFPLGFCWIAAQWPAAVEAFITLRLKMLVTTVTGGLLNTTGCFALQRGNILELTNGSVGVDTACSGITSLQSSLMFSLFLGEYFRLAAGRRMALTGAALGTALAVNCARVYTLATILEARGEAFTERWHDGLGHTETVLILLAIFGTAFALSRWRKAPAPAPAAATGALAPSPAFGLAAALVFAGVPLLAGQWFALVRGRAPLQVERPRWRLERAVPAPWQVRPVALTPEERRILGYTEGEAILLRDPAGAELTLFHFFWDSGSPAVGPYLHTPDICLTFQGWTQRGEAVPATLHLPGAEFPTRLYRFERDGRQVTAFETVWFGRETANELTRLGLLWKNPRGYGMEVLEGFMPPSPDLPAQVRAAEEALRQVLRSNAPPVGP